MLEDSILDNLERGHIPELNLFDSADLRESSCVQM